MIEAAMSDGSRRLALREFLRQCRSRLRPEDVGLMSVGHRRVAGLRREEVAGLAGISPLWYTLLETGRYRRVSPQMLHRLSTVLRLTDAEKAYLFSQAIDEFPAIPTSTLRAESHDALGAFQWLRSLSKRLWVSSTQDEALQVARDCAMKELRGDVVATRTRVGNGRWEYLAIGDDDNLGNKVLVELSARWGAAILDKMHCLTEMTRAGEFLTRAEQETRSPDMAAKRNEALDAVGWRQSSWAMASIQSRHGLISRLVVFHSTEHAYSTIERAKLTAIADLTSLALSG
jgi:transcriptional regulator with XRE-family HTH domain